MAFFRISTFGFENFRIISGSMETTMLLGDVVGSAADRYVPTLQDWGPIVAPNGALLVMGDNRAWPLATATRWERIFSGLQ